MNIKDRINNAPSWGGICVLFVIAGLSLPAFSGSSDPTVGELSQSLESLVEGANRLVAVNDELTARNNTLKEKSDSSRARNELLIKSNDQLSGELAVYQQKIKNRTEVVEHNQLKVNEAEARLVKMDQNIESKKIALAQRQKQHEYVFKLLAIVNNGGMVDQNIQTVRKTQEQLIKKLDEGRRRVEDLEGQWKELSFWYGDAALTLPQLKGTRDHLKEKLAALKGTGVLEDWSDLQAQILKLKKEIKTLSQRHFSYFKTLEVIEKEYLGKDAAAQAGSDERKLEQTLSRLKKDNKTIQRQAADLRFEMIDLDKKKTSLESSLAQNR